MSLSGVLDFLYRWRWLTFLPFAVVLVTFGDLSDRRDQPVAWVTVGLLAVVVWVPIAVRWIRGTSQAKRAFRDAQSAGRAQLPRDAH